MTLRALPKDRFIGDRLSLLATQHGLQLGAELVFDVLNHVLVAELNEIADDYEDMIVKRRGRPVSPTSPARSTRSWQGDPIADGGVRRSRARSRRRSPPRAAR